MSCKPPLCVKVELGCRRARFLFRLWAELGLLDDLLLAHHVWGYKVHCFGFKVKCFGSWVTTDLWNPVHVLVSVAVVVDKTAYDENLHVHPVCSTQLAAEQAYEIEAINREKTWCSPQPLF